MNTKFWPSLTLAFALTGPAIAQLPPASDEYTSLKIIQTTAPGFPLRLRNSVVMEGDAWVVVRVDLNGQLTEWLVTGYTRREFADTAVEALKAWKYEPATIRGERWATVREVRFNFSRSGVVVSQTGLETLDNYMERLMPNRQGFRAFKLRELDRIPVPSKVVPPEYPESLAAKGVKGSVTVEFYIDPSGKVRMPGALKWTEQALAHLAVTAVEQWQFEPPVHDGQPVLVLVRQEFTFQPKF